MNETDFIGGLQDRLSSALSVPVMTLAEDEYPVPVVLIEDWDSREQNYNNSPLRRETVKRTKHGPRYVKHLSFHYETRVELTVRHSDEVEASRLCDSIKDQLRLLRNKPSMFSSDLSAVRISASGNPNYQFTEPVETEQTVTARFKLHHETTAQTDQKDADPIELIQNTFNFNPN